MIDAAVAPGQRSRVRSRHRCPAPRLLRSFPHVPGSNTLQARVERALAQLKHPRHGKDVLSAGMVRELSVDGAGQVTFTFILTQQDPPTLAREARKAVQGVEGVTAVRVNLTDAGAAPAGGGGGGAAAPRQAAPRPAGGVPPPPTPVEMPNLGKVLAVSSGKGGVGKSTVSVNLAVALAQQGQRVGLMDADIYGPNIMKVIQQFVRDVDWGQLDYFIVDLPPGTGDAQLSLAQTLHIRGAIIVTTPQEVSVGDALRGAKMFERVGVPVIGVVENMSYFVCPHCGERTAVFLPGFGSRLAQELGVPLLGQVPLQARMADLADSGRPIGAAEPASPAAQALGEVARHVAEQLAAVPG